MRATIEDHLKALAVELGPIEVHIAVTPDTVTTTLVTDSGGWTEDLSAVLQRGPTLLEVIYREVEKRRRAGGRSWTANSKATIRCHLQRHCAEAAHFNPKWTDLFRTNGNGRWRLK